MYVFIVSGTVPWSTVYWSIVVNEQQQQQKGLSSFQERFERRKNAYFLDT